MLILVSVLLVAIPPLSAYAWTRYRYGSWSPDFANAGSETSGFLVRQYNDAYHQTTEAWEVRYYNTSGGITLSASSWSSPTHIGPTTGDRQAWCSLTGLLGNWVPGAANCDTTVP
jgi:hypothetical protein